MISFRYNERVIVLTEDITESNCGELITHIIEFNELDKERERERKKRKEF